MTAEVAILNKSAVALAADSAVTAGTTSNQKIFNSVNKLFNLSKYHPVGIMINNNAEYMGVPWETIIKTFRKDLGKKSNLELHEYAVDFIKFINSNFRDKEEIDHNISRIIYSRLSKIYTNVSKGINKEILNTKRISTRKQNQILKLATNNEIKDLLDEEDSESVSDFKNNEFWNKYNRLCDYLIDDFFENIKVTKSNRNLIKKYIELSIKKDVFSDFHTEIIFAGFGDSEDFPVLLSVTTDGIVQNYLKFRQNVYAEISTNFQSGLFAFAQGEMVFRFMNGIDPDFEKYFFITISNILHRFGADFINNYISSSEQKRQVTRKLKAEISKTLTTMFDDANKFKNDFFSSNIVQALGYLPTDEMGNLAEALVNLTSLKRKVSSDQQETVGGPIDVAVITKHDGFIWINRKHYFDKELNPHFTTKYFM